MRHTRTKSRRETEDESMRRQDEMVVATLPGPGLQLVVRRQFQNGRHVFPVGSIIADVTTLGKNYTTLLAGHFLEWRPSDAKPPAQARALPPPPAPPKPNPRVEIVEDPDVVTSWRKTLALTAERCGDDFGKARDLLAAHREGSALFLRATKVWCEQTAQARGVVSVAPEGL